MKKTKFHVNWILALLFALVSGLVQAQSEPYQAGVHYTELENAPAVNNGQNELYEAFSYLCTHCHTFEPYINSWLERKPENVTFTRIPIVFGRAAWELYARGYVTAQTMGIADESHAAMMDRIWKEKAVMRSMDELAKFYSQFGVTAESFLATSKSFAVDARLRKEQRMAMDWQIQGTPSLVLNGKYRIEGNEAIPSYDAMLDVVDYLIAKETAEALEYSAAVAPEEETDMNAELDAEAKEAAAAQVEDVPDQ